MSTFQTFLSVWGAALATILAVIKAVEFFRNKPRIKVRAELRSQTTDRNADIKGTLVDTKHSVKEILLSFTAINEGRQPLQIIGCLVEDANGNLNQIIPAGLPALLQPYTQVQVEIQKEWLDDVEVRRLGVIDALGRIHAIKPSSMTQLVQRANELPSNKKEYRHRETGEIVKAFQMKDKGVLTRKNP